VRANFAALAYYTHYASHRERLTELVSSSRNTAAGELCVLGAGNAYDLDLDWLCATYQRVHLVDIDERALARTWERQEAPTRARLVRHAPVELSGFDGVLSRWVDRRVAPHDIEDQPLFAAEAILSRLGQTFDTVLSACVLSQMQLMLRRVLTDRHPLFGSACLALNRTHLRTLSGLRKPGGRAVFATDIASFDGVTVFDLDEATRTPLACLDRLLASGDVFSVVDPRWLAAIARDVPALCRQSTLRAPKDVWLWNDGPTRVLLVYAAEL
jgi:hypothetical protein